MTAPPLPPSETPGPASPERPRLIINGEPVRPEELGRNLSASVQLRLSIRKEPYEPPEPLPHAPVRASVKVSAFPSRALGVLLVLLALGMAALVLLRR
ncbi:hypothetical protein JRI60_29945 [Archangium violaceum]|uniref:hypothetical protein n=1 Tax=Archangium violaceum TaxID=83451 RepID=UPI00194ED022|nr:hypothetical protein [Archangium violaceum]QRN93405.1 hypothetical protein JRI60_29945 [Archangium violaceum]